MKKRGLRFQLTAGFAIIVLATIAVVSFAANHLIRRQFRDYIISGQQEFAHSLAENLQSQYDEETEGWNLDYVHGFGMYALDDGYVIRLYDAEHNSLWDAENHDMALCHQIMSSIEQRMVEKLPGEDTEYITVSYELNKDGRLIGSAEISYYSPYYSDESDFDFLNALNRIVFVIGIIALLGAGVCGFIYAHRFIRPLQETSRVAGRIAAGDYRVDFSDASAAREIKELQDSVRRMAESLEANEQRERNLTRDVAHELRTPLANVSSYLEAITEGVWEPTKERLSDCMQEIDRLKAIIADLEELHDLEDDKPKLHKEDFDLQRLAEKAACNFDTVLEKNDLEIELQGEEAYISADKNRIYQAVFNLISNAVKYTKPGDKIIIKTEDNGAYVSLKVINHGDMISKEDQKLIFGRFYRADGSRSRKTGGAGIGLAIVKAIVEAHNGKISVSSDEKETCFAIRLPT